MPSPRVVILGKPNVGKSTLLNRLIGKRVAIVHDLPGVTRDWQEYAIPGCALAIADTPGLPHEGFSEHTEGSIAQLVSESALVVFLIDGKAGISSDDRDLAQWIRKRGKPVVVAVNKCERFDACPGLAEADTLGFETVLPISAKHGDGVGALFSTLESMLPAEKEDVHKVEERPLSIVVLGRPNVGKSTFINQCLGNARLLAGPESGITRDAITVSWSYKGRALRLVDTAGLRKRAAVRNTLEKDACSETYHALVFADIALVLVDVTCPFDVQDIVIMSKVIQEGRGLIVVLNKWDLISGEERETFLKACRKTLSARISEGRSISLIPISSRNKTGFKALWKEVFALDERWNTRIQTAELNRFLQAQVNKNPPPVVKRWRIRVKYMTQIKARPPRFLVFGNQVDLLPESWQRYLFHALVEQFGLHGVPVKIAYRKASNPMTEEK